MVKRKGKRLACLILVAMLLPGCGGKKTQTPDDGTAQSPPTQTQARELSVTELLTAVLSAREELDAAMTALESQDPVTALAALDRLQEQSQRIGQSLDVTLVALEDELPSVGKSLENIQGILGMMEEMNQNLLRPLGELQLEYPLDVLRQGDGIWVGQLVPYLDFLEQAMPTLEQLLTQARSLDLSMLGEVEDLEEKLKAGERLLELYHQDPKMLNHLKNILGAGEDRTYLLAAQNSAEIRASGGFPGSMGVVRIQDGVLRLEDFRKVYDVLSDYTPYQAKLTIQENALFHGGLSVPRDADYCPDFERVAYVWALGYETRQGEEIDGVISMTPAVVQRLLAALDGEVTLSDGMVLNGENAVKALQYDLYFQYFGTDYVEGRYSLADSLFSEAARKIMECLPEHMDGIGIKACLDVAKESVADRTMLFWMKDSGEQSLIEEMGCSGGLNRDPASPQAGIYYNCTIASKMGWYLELDATMGQPVENADGSSSYPITVVLTNIMTQEECQQAGWYITGGAGGAIEGSVYFFAPAGGTVQDFRATNSVSIQRDTYHDLDMGYMMPFQIGMGKSVTITYMVTTAPGAGELTFSTTPTLQAYH